MDEMNIIMYTVACEVVKKQEDIIRSVVQYIGGETFIDITVDRDKVIEALTDYAKKHQALGAEALPTADVEEVVRCHRCSSWQVGIGFCDSPTGHCLYFGMDTDRESYCSFGERKEK